MSFSDGGGGLEVGSVFARVGAMFDPRGWDQQQVAVDKARAEADKPIEGKGTFAGQAGRADIDRFKTALNTARVEADKPIVGHAAVRVDPTGFRTLSSGVATARGELHNAERDVEGFVGKLSGLGFGLARFGAAAGGMLAAFGGFEVLKTGMTRMKEMEQTAAVTEARLKSTGGAAGITAKQMDQLSQAIFRKTGVDHEQVLQAENLLLTYRNVRNEVGKGHDVYNQATKAATDLSAGLGTSLISN